MAVVMHTCLQERAVAYCNETKAQPQCWQLCLEKYSTTSYLEVRFWCLQTMHEVCVEHACMVVCFLVANPERSLEQRRLHVVQVLITRYGQLSHSACSMVSCTVRISAQVGLGARLELVPD